MRFFCTRNQMADFGQLSGCATRAGQLSDRFDELKWTDRIEGRKLLLVRELA